VWMNSEGMRGLGLMEWKKRGTRYSLRDGPILAPVTREVLSAARSIPYLFLTTPVLPLASCLPGLAERRAFAGSKGTDACHHRDRPDV
jgi:hypothetical protein